jgi:hypothetical protein
MRLKLCDYLTTKLIIYDDTKSIIQRFKISNHKHQITNKPQIPTINDQNSLGFRILVIVICWYFVIWNLEFGIFVFVSLEATKLI